MIGDHRTGRPSVHAAWLSQPLVGGPPRRDPLRLLCGLSFVAGASLATIVALLA